MNSKITYWILYIFSFLWNIILLIFLFSTWTSSELEFYFHSDLLSFPTLYKDIIHDGYSFFDWAIGGATYIVPDRFLYFILHYFCKDFRITAMVFTIIQYFIILILSNKIVTYFSKQNSVIINAVINFLFSLFIIVAIKKVTFTFSIFILLCNYHIGAFVLLLLALIYTFKTIENSTKKNNIILFIIISISVLSDRMFMLYYSIPCVIVFIYNYFKYKKQGIILLNCVSGSILGILLHKSLIWFKILTLNSNYQIFSFSKSIESFKILFTQMSSSIVKFDTIGVIESISFIVYVLAIISALRLFIKNKYDYSSKQHFLLVFYILFFTITFFIQPLNGNYFATWLIRYIMAVFYVSILFLPLLISIIFPSVSLKYISIVSIPIILIIGITTMHAEQYYKGISNGLQSYKNYVPEYVTKVDSLASKYNAKYGVSSFFEAKVITSFSKKDIRVYSVFENLIPWKHGCNKTWYISNKGKYSNPRFEFGVFLKGYNLKNAERVGKPISVDTIGRYIFIRFKPYTYLEINNRIEIQASDLINK